MTEKDLKLMENRALAGDYGWFSHIALSLCKEIRSLRKENSLREEAQTKQVKLPPKDTATILLYREKTQWLLKQ